jgi:hypothetical protein
MFHDSEVTQRVMKVLGRRGHRVGDDLPRSATLLR